MGNTSSTKFYIGGVIILLVIIAVVAVLLGSAKHTEQGPAESATVATSTTSTATTSATTSAATDGLVGTWGSAEAGKGVQGSGKVTISGTSYQISLDGDVNLVIQKVENGAAVGTIAYNNLCLTTVVTAPGKAPVTKPAQCVSSPAIPATIQINGSTLTFTGKSQLGSDISFSGNFANGKITGTFTRMSSYGKVSGSFDLVRTTN